MEVSLPDLQSLLQARTPQATFAAIRITHPNLRVNCQRLSCTAGNAGGRFPRGRRMCAIKRNVILIYFQRNTYLLGV